MKLLLAAGSPVNFKVRDRAHSKTTTLVQEPVLHLALRTMHGDRDVLREMLAAGADASLPDQDGRQPLHVVVGNPDGSGEGRARVLLAAGADPNAADNRGVTPVHVAERDPGASGTLQLLLAAGGVLSGTTPYCCPTCGRAFGRTEALVAHRLIHSSSDCDRDTPAQR